MPYLALRLIWQVMECPLWAFCNKMNVLWRSFNECIHHCTDSIRLSISSTIQTTKFWDFIKVSSATKLTIFQSNTPPDETIPFWRDPKNLINTLRPRQNGRHFADDTFKRTFMNEIARISIKISLKFVPKDLINNIPALVQIMAWRRPGDKPLSEPMMVSSPTHICVTRPQWVKFSDASRVEDTRKHSNIQILWSMFSFAYQMANYSGHSLCFINGYEAGVVYNAGFDNSSPLCVFFNSSPLDKMAAISQTTFSMHWQEWKVSYLIQISLKFVPEGPIDNKSASVYLSHCFPVHWHIHVNLWHTEIITGKKKIYFTFPVIP